MECQWQLMQVQRRSGSIQFSNRHVSKTYGIIGMWATKNLAQGRYLWNEITSQVTSHVWQYRNINGRRNSLRGGTYVDSWTRHSNLHDWCVLFSHYQITTPKGFRQIWLGICSVYYSVPLVIINVIIKPRPQGGLFVCLKGTLVETRCHFIDIHTLPA